MTASAATIGYGLQLTMATHLMPEGFSLDGPSAERDMIDVSNFQSPSGFKEFIGGLIDGGEVTLSGNYLPANTYVKAFMTALVAFPQAVVACTIVLTDSGASVISFNALPKSHKPKGAVADKLSADFVLKVTGAITYPS